MNLDPHLSAEQLHELAKSRPDLHYAILEHPACYPELAQWIHMSDSQDYVDIPSEAMNNNTTQAQTDPPVAGPGTTQSSLTPWKLSSLVLLSVILMVGAAFLVWLLAQPHNHDSSGKKSHDTPQVASENMSDDKDTKKDKARKKDGLAKTKPAPDAIRHVDIENTLIPFTVGDGCDMQAHVKKPPTELEQCWIEIIDGKGRYEFATPFYETGDYPRPDYDLELKDEPIYLDVNGDGYEDVIRKFDSNMPVQLSLYAYLWIFDPDEPHNPSITYIPFVHLALGGEDYQMQDGYLVDKAECPTIKMEFTGSGSDIEITFHDTEPDSDTCLY